MSPSLRVVDFDVVEGKERQAASASWSEALDVGEGMNKEKERRGEGRKKRESTTKVDAGIHMHGLYGGGRGV